MLVYWYNQIGIAINILDSFASFLCQQLFLELEKVYTSFTLPDKSIDYFAAIRSLATLANSL